MSAGSTITVCSPPGAPLLQPASRVEMLRGAYSTLDDYTYTAPATSR